LSGRLSRLVSAAVIIVCMAQMKIDQDGLSPGLPGVARKDGLSNGALVTLTDLTVGGTTLFEILWVDPADTTSINSLVAQEDPHVWAFSPEPDLEGPIRIRLTHTTPQGIVTTQTRIFGIPDASGVVRPAPGERSDPDATRINQADAAVIERCERNWPTTEFPGGNPFGWGPDLLESFDNAIGTNAEDVVAAQGAADDAQATADGAVTAAAAAQSTANTGVTNATTAQTTANTGVTNAATAQSAATSAASAASAAQTTANTGVTNAAAAAAAAAAAQSTANTGVTNAATAATAAAAAQTTANTGVTNAATAQSTANTGVTNAATAATAAAAAQTTANTGVTNAAAAQSTATAAASAISTHVADQANPHAVTATQVGLGTAAADITAVTATANAAVPKATYDANSILKADSDNTPVVLVVAASTVVGRKASGGIAALTSAEVEALLTGLVPKALYDANSVVIATTDDTPIVLAVPVSTIVGRKASGDISAMSATEAAALLTDLVPKSLFDANTVLAATSDNTPVALTVGASTFVGRKASGGISAMSAVEAAVVLTDLVPKSLFDANTILIATTDDTPTALTVAASRIVGRKSSGGIAALTAAELCSILGIQPNMFLDVPTTPSSDDVEITAADLGTLGFSVYNFTDSQVCTRAGNVNPWGAQSGTTSYWSTYRNGRLLFQGATNAGISKAYFIYKSLVGGIPNSDCFYTAVGSHIRGDALTDFTSVNGSVTLNLFATSGGLPDSANRYTVGWIAVRASTTDSQLYKNARVAGSDNLVPATVNSKLWPLFTGGIVGLRFNGSHGALGFALDPTSGATAFLGGAYDTNDSLVAAIDKWGWQVSTSNSANTISPPYGVVTLGPLRRCATFPGMT
jgi:hypothetical protein